MELRNLSKTRKGCLITQVLSKLFNSHEMIKKKKSHGQEKKQMETWHGSREYIYK